MKTTIEVLEAIRLQGKQTYPEECCGLLLGWSTERGNEISDIFPINNHSVDNRHRRYLIGASDYFKANREAQKKGVDIVGIYHSHPDHPAVPSATDLDQATFPGYTYLIVSVRAGEPAEMAAWSLANDRSQFESIQIHIDDSIAQGRLTGLITKLTYTNKY